MKKYLMMALVATLSLGFVSCGDDDEEEIKPEEEQVSESAKVLDELKQNHVTFGSWKNIQIEAGAWSILDEFAVNVNYYNLEERMGMGTQVIISKDMLGKTINLASPHATVGNGKLRIENQLYEIQVDGVFPPFNFRGAFIYLYENGKMDMSSRTFRIFDKDDVPYSEYNDPETCFEEGSVKIEKKENGAYLTLNGTLKGGMVVAIKGFVPTEEIKAH